MKTETLVVLGAAGVAAWWLLSEKRAADQEACRQRGSEFVWYKGECIDVIEYELKRARGE